MCSNQNQRQKQTRETIRERMRMIVLEIEHPSMLQSRATSIRSLDGRSAMQQSVEFDRCHRVRQSPLVLHSSRALELDSCLLVCWPCTIFDLALADQSLILLLMLLSMLVGPLIHHLIQSNPIQSNPIQSNQSMRKRRCLVGERVPWRVTNTDDRSVIPIASRS